MRSKLFIGLLLVGLSCTLTAQNVIIANSNLNILYIGIQNRIDFASKTISRKDIQLVPQRGKIITEFGRSVFRCCSSKEVGPLVIYARNRRTNRLIDSVEFRLKKVPDPKIRLITSNVSGGSYAGSDLGRDIYGVVCYMIDEFTDQACTIVGFTLTIVDSVGFKRDIYVAGSRLSEDVKQDLAKLNASCSVNIHAFKVLLGCEDEARLLDSVITLK